MSSTGEEPSKKSSPIRNHGVSRYLKRDSHIAVPKKPASQSLPTPKLQRRLDDCLAIVDHCPGSQGRTVTMVSTPHTPQLDVKSVWVECSFVLKNSRAHETIMVITFEQHHVIPNWCNVAHSCLLDHPLHKN
jgi:hypothetical protein